MLDSPAQPRTTLGVAMVKPHPHTPYVSKVVNAENFQANLDLLKKGYKTNRVGYHEQTYGLMANALPIALLLRSKKKLKKKFLRHLKSRRSGGAPINIVTEVMVYVAGATSESARKIAWKRGRVIEYLHKEGIKVGKIAAEIKSRGGVNAVLKQATEDDPRRDKALIGTKISDKKSKPPVVKTRDKEDCDMSGSDEVEVTPAKSAGRWGSNDRQVIMQVLIKLSDRDFIDELPVDSRVKIIATLINEKGAKIEVNQVKQKQGVRKKEDDGEREL